MKLILIGAAVWVAASLVLGVALGRSIVRCQARELDQVQDRKWRRY